MNHAFKIMSFFWILSPLIFAVLRLSGIVNVYQQNWTIGIVLCGFSFVAMFLNSDTR